MESIIEKEIFEALKELQIESDIKRTDEEIDQSNLPSYKAEWLKYTWFKLYLHKMRKLGINEFRLVINENKSGLIHPLGKDGETLDFKL